MPECAGRLVCGADAIPDHVHDDRRAVILDHDHLEPVVEREAAASAACSGRAAMASAAAEAKKHREVSPCNERVGREATPACRGIQDALTRA